MTPADPIPPREAMMVRPQPTFGDLVAASNEASKSSTKASPRARIKVYQLKIIKDYSLQKKIDGFTLYRIFHMLDITINKFKQLYLY